MDGVQWAWFRAPCPLLALMSTVPRPHGKYIFLKITTPKMKISTFKYHFFIFHFTIKNVLIDTGSPSDMPVDMFIVPHVHGAPSLGHHGHFLDFFKLIAPAKSSLFNRPTLSEHDGALRYAVGLSVGL